MSDFIATVTALEFALVEYERGNAPLTRVTAAREAVMRLHFDVAPQSPTYGLSHTLKAPEVRLNGEG